MAAVDECDKRQLRTEVIIVCHFTCGFDVTGAFVSSILQRESPVVVCVTRWRISHVLA